MHLANEKKGVQVRKKEKIDVLCIISYITLERGQDLINES